MNQPLRVLVIDDNPGDRILAIRELSREFPNFQVEEILDAKGFAQAVEQGNFDLVITDYQLRWTNGIQVLRAIKERYPYRPVIMFTGTGSEEIAVEAMQSGLDDYVLKSPNRYFRLPTAVRVALERAQAERRAALLEIRLQSLLNQLDIGIFRSTTDGQLLESNRAFLRLLGVNSLPEAQSMDLLNLPELGAQYQGTLSFQPQEREVQLHRADGTSIWTSLNITLNQVDDETVVDGLLEDITARKQAQAEIRQLNETLEQRVRERTHELEVANQDLEAFAYSVSHDLREPLRSIQGLAQALLEDYAQALNSVGQSYSQAIVNVSQQMDEFIEDLLIYSRLRREEIPIQPTNLGAVVTEALQQLESALQEQQAQLLIEEPLPEVMGNRLILIQVLKNLLSNGVKFVAPGQQPEVRVWAEEMGRRRDGETGRRGECQIRLWVEDKGIGIDVQNQKRIFYVFERLHGSEIYPGTGIGLAIVRKGVERMGGQAGVESQLGQGSRFWIELPKVPEI